METTTCWRWRLKKNNRFLDFLNKINHSFKLCSHQTWTVPTTGTRSKLRVYNGIKRHQLCLYEWMTCLWCARCICIRGRVYINIGRGKKLAAECYNKVNFTTNYFVFVDKSIVLFRIPHNNLKLESLSVLSGSLELTVSFLELLWFKANIEWTLSDDGHLILISFSHLCLFTLTLIDSAWNV